MYLLVKTLGYDTKCPTSYSQNLEITVSTVRDPNQLQPKIKIIYLIYIACCVQFINVQVYVWKL